MTEKTQTNGTEEARLRDEVERLRDEKDELEERVEELEELINKAFCEQEGVGNVAVLAYNANEKAYNLRDRIDELEDKQRVSNSEPSTKVERARDHIVENFERWSVRFKRGRAVATDVSKGDATGAKKSVTKWVNEADDEEIQHKIVYDAMKKVEEDYNGYEYEEVGSKGDKTRYVWRVEE